LEFRRQTSAGEKTESAADYVAAAGRTFAWDGWSAVRRSPLTEKMTIEQPFDPVGKV